MTTARTGGLALDDTADADYATILLGDAAEAGAAMYRLAAALGAAKRGVRHAIALYPRDGLSPGALLDCTRHLLDGLVRPPTAAGVSVVVVEPTMIRLHLLAERVAASRTRVLLRGETGSGKESLAETIHRASPRRDQPLVRLNCAAFSETLLESELFGHEKGAFTGAAQTKLGLLEAAHLGPSSSTRSVSSPSRSRRSSSVCSRTASSCGSARSGRGRST